MYDLIYQYVLDYLFNGTSLTGGATILGQTMTINQWLAHSTTIFAICLIIFLLIWFIKWIFKIVGGIILLK